VHRDQLVVHAQALAPGNDALSHGQKEIRPASTAHGQLVDEGILCLSGGHIEAWSPRVSPHLGNADDELAARQFTDGPLPKGYPPFNTQALGGRIFVTYDKIDPVTHREAVGRGIGVVDEFGTDGHLIPGSPPAAP
jgi:hypothetical protein